jgi:CzcA family heavy metal efflux pump
MMRWIVGSSLKFRYIVLAISAAMMFFGVQKLRDMPVDAFPEFAPQRVEIQTIATGLNAVDVESLVSIPLEEALVGIKGVNLIRSKSVPQLSSIELQFEKGTNLTRARQLVQERVEAVTPSLPTWAAPPFMIPATSTTARVVKIGVSSKTLSIQKLSTIAYWKIRARLLRVPGVANVALWGEHLEQFHVEVDPRRMRAENVSLDQIMEATSDSLDAGLLRFSDGQFIGTGGFVDTPNQRFAIQHVLSIRNPSDLAQVVIEEREGKAVRVGDVADVRIDTQPLIGNAVINGGPGILMIVEKYPWGNTLDVTHGVEAALDEMRPGLHGVEIDTHVFRAANFIDKSIENLTKSLLIGSLLVILVLGAFLFEWRAALISLVSIPLSLVGAGLVLYLRGETINVMVLAGLILAVGVVVDDAIIGIENVVRRLRQYRHEGGERSTMSIILEASLEVRGPILYATLIILAGMMPIFFLTSLTGTFFKPLALSYVLAVAASLVVALTITPALALMLLGNAQLERRQPPLVRWLQGGYRSLLTRIIHRPRPAYVVVGLAVAAGLAVVPFLGESLIPTFKERDFLGHWITKPGTSITEETRAVTRAGRELRSIPGVAHFGSHIGQAFLGDETAGVNFGENWIAIDPSADYDKTRAAIEETVASYPGFFHDVQTYLNERIDEVLTGTSEPIVVRIFGSDLNVLHRQANEVRDVMARIDGVKDAYVELQEGVPQLQVEVKLDAAQRYGLKPGDVRRAAATLVESEEVGDIFRAGRAYDVHVWSTPETRNSVTSIRELPLDTPSGQRVLLADVADVRIEPTPNVVHHEGNSRSIDVLAGADPNDVGAVVSELKDRLENVELPLGYSYQLLGEYAERQAAQSDMLYLGIGAGIVIFLLLNASFGSFRLATMSFLTLPMALVGGALAAYFSDGVLSLGSLVGFYTVFGIAARNGILMVNHFQHLERYEGETFGSDLVLRGASERLAPILMTTLAAGLALVPLVVAGRIPGHEIEYPLAIVVLGGLATSTLLNLFVLPSLYLRFGRPSVATVPARLDANVSPQSA